LSGKGYSYTENEYFFSGTATNLERGVKAPYESRMLVRLLSDPTKFNGTVIVEWLNVTGQRDIETLWPITGEYLMQHGYGYVDVDAQLVGVCCLLPGDPGPAPSQRNLAPLFEGVPGLDPMRGMVIKHLVADGASQSASELSRKWERDVLPKRENSATSPHQVPEVPRGGSITQEGPATASCRLGDGDRHYARLWDA
jgi:hypothetical protein